jgi:hypothetical protein
MHFVGFVITEQKPSEDVLAKVLHSFRSSREGGKGHWDWWTLGGRWSGRMIPLSLDNTVTGGADVPAIEGRLRPLGATHFVTQSDQGVDIVQISNIKEGFAPYVLIIDGQWHKCDDDARSALVVQSFNAMLGGAPPSDTDEAALARWDEEWKSLMDHVPADHWLSVIDFHN